MSKREEKSDLLPKQNWRWAGVLSVFGAVAMAFGLFMIIPLTQFFDEEPDADLVVRELTLVVPPPPELPPPPEEEEEIPVQEEISVSDLSEPAPVEVQPLEVALSPGTGEALSIGPGMSDFQLESGGVAAIEELFTFEDLQEAPRLVNMPRFRFPRGLQRQGISEGKVVVEIDILPDGRAEFRKIISSTHRELEPVAREIVQQARFTRPVVDGKAEKVRGHFPLLLSN